MQRRWAPMLQTALLSLAEANARGRLCLVLGAGLNCDLGLPRWSELAQALIEHDESLDDLDDDNIEALKAANMPLVLELVSDSELWEHLRRTLYCRWNCDREPIPRSWVEDGVAGMPFHETALAPVAALATLIARSDPHRPFHVVTYNADTLLEEAIAAHGHPVVALGQAGHELSWLPERVRHHTRSAYFPWRLDASMGPRTGKPAEVRVLHPHGIAPRLERRRSQARRSSSSSDLVFTASQYEARYAHMADSFNATQVTNFGTNACLFYGFFF